MFLYWLFLAKSSGTATAITGNSITFMSSLKPKMATIHAVNVVPTLAPNITAIDCSRLIRPALTKLTTITVDADELWMSAVMTMPVSTPIKRFLVITASIERRRLPAAFCRPSLITFIPYRNKPTAPSRAKKSRKE